MRQVEFDGQQVNIPNVKIPHFGGGAIRWVLLLLVAVVLLFTSIYTVGPEEIGVVLQFGKFVRTTDPGLHLKIPFGIEMVQKVPIQRQLKDEFGFRTVRGGVKSQFTTSGYSDESLMLTGDLNAAVVEWIIQFRIVDPYQYLFRVRGVLETFHAMSEAVMRRIVGDRTVNEVLTVGRQEVAAQVEEQLQELCDQYETGIKVEQVVLQDVNPPDQVKPSFNEVNEAQQEREKLINQAQSEYNKVVPRAAGEAQQTIQEARGYALDRINRARGDSARFVALYESYRSAPEVTRKRIYLETMSEIIPLVDRKIIIDDDLRSILPLLNLNEMDSGK